MFGIGKATQAQAQAPTQSGTPANQWNAPSVPGKVTETERTQPVAAPATRSAEAETESTPSATATGGAVQGALLDVLWHGNVYAGLVGDVADAQANFQVACAEVMTDIKIEPAEVSFLTELAYNAVGVLAIGAITKSFERLAHHAEELEKLDELVGTSDIPIAQVSARKLALAAAIGSVPIRSIDFIAEQAVDKGKKSSLTSASAASAADEKSAGIAWLEEIQRSGPIAFRVFRDSAAPLPLPALLVLREAFGREDHSPPAYKAQIEEHYKVFKESGVAEIGAADRGPIEEDMRAVRVQHRDGTTRLALIAHKTDRREELSHDGALAESYEWRSWIDNEFTNVAIALTTARFGSVDTIDASALRFIKGAPSE